MSVSTQGAIVEELRPSPEPVDAFERLADLPWVLFLDSAAPGGVHGRYSYVSALPAEVVVSRAERTQRLERRGRAGDYFRTQPTTTGPFACIRERLAGRHFEKIDGLPPFQGGAAGLFGYGLSRRLEHLPPPRHDEFSVPDLTIGIYDWVLAFDHERGTCHLIAHALNSSAPAMLDEVRRRLADPVGRPARARHATGVRPLPAAALAPQSAVPGAGDLTSNFERAAYLDAVRQAVEYIHAGDVFQVNLSQRLLHPARCHPVDLYLRLRASNPAPFAGYFDLGDFVVASSSPEQFLSLTGDEVVTRPIKGTRSRGYTPEEDSFRRLDLRQSGKDMAENVMIVDLLRNDLSKVCRPHTVTVPRLFDLEVHPTVHHLVSEVRGRLRPGRTAVDLLEASFPGGSITGAPKVRAMEIIAELEPTARGPYCGCLGWIAFHGGMGTSILIRTITAGRGWLQLPVGGGIVADSVPSREYQETLDKAAGMVNALL